MDDQATFIESRLGTRAKRKSKKTKTDAERENQGHYVLNDKVEEAISERTTILLLV